jgi:hypothetical protein
MPETFREAGVAGQPIVTDFVAFIARGIVASGPEFITEENVTDSRVRQSPLKEISGKMGGIPTVRL